jgi:hypothetical protein
MRKALYTVYFYYEDGRIASQKYTSKATAVRDTREMREELKAEGIIRATLNDLKHGTADRDIPLN